MSAPTCALLRQQLAEALKTAEYGEWQARKHRALALQADNGARYWRAQASLLRRHIAELEQQQQPDEVAP